MDFIFDCWTTTKRRVSSSYLLKGYNKKKKKRKKTNILYKIFWFESTTTKRAKKKKAFKYEDGKKNEVNSLNQTLRTTQQPFTLYRIQNVNKTYKIDMK